MKKNVSALVGLTSVVLLCSGAAHAEGLYWESTTTGIGPSPRVSQFYAMPKRFKEVTSDGKVTLLRTDQDKMFIIDTKAKTYRAMTFAELEQAAQAAQGAMAKMQEQLKDMPPEQRAMMEKMIPQMPSAGAKPSVTVKSTGETKTVSGHACTKYVGTDSGKTVLVAWATKDVSGFDALRSDWMTLHKRMASVDRVGGLAGAYEHIDGFPMETEAGSIKTVVTKVESRTTAASEFEIPAGFKQLPSEILQMPH